jgi:serine/threonine protein kinase
MSEVWRAHDQVLGRDVAVKVLAPDGPGTDPRRPARIRLEARAAAGLRHPHIVEVHDYGEATDDAGRARPYVVMELVEGTSLDRLLRDRAALPWDTATRICAQVAAALAAAHAHGVVHRDVKPGNVMVTPDGVKLVDFGISAAAGAVDETDGEVLGTPAYLAPERLDGGPVRVATDVYALGLLLYRALAGRLPWTGTTVTQMVGDHLYTDPAPLPPIAGLPPQVADLVRRCLAKRPQDRPGAAEAARILGAAAGLSATEPLTLPTVTAGAGAPAVAPRLSRPGILLATVVAALAMLAAAAWWPTDAPRSVQAAPSAPAPSAPAPSSPAAAPESTAAPADRPAARSTPAATAKGKAKPKAKPAKKPKPAKPPGKSQQDPADEENEDEKDEEE